MDNQQEWNLNLIVLCHWDFGIVCYCSLFKHILTDSLVNDGGSWMPLSRMRASFYFSIHWLRIYTSKNCEFNSILKWICISLTITLTYSWKLVANWMGSSHLWWIIHGDHIDLRTLCSSGSLDIRWSKPYTGRQKPEKFRKYNTSIIWS